MNETRTFVVIDTFIVIDDENNAHMVRAGSREEAVRHVRAKLARQAKRGKKA